LYQATPAAAASSLIARDQQLALSGKDLLNCGRNDGEDDDADDYCKQN